MATKFLRNLIYTTGSASGRVSFYLKVMYEFWGYCVFGGASLLSHGTGAFAATTPFGGSLPGNFNGVGTTITAGSNGASLPQATINVTSTTGFPTSGTIYVFTNQGTQTVTYTGVTGTTFTGCTGGSGTMSTGGNVTSSSLLTIGSDGYTNATTVYRQDGYSDFFSTSGNFTSNMVGKQLVAWKAGSNSSEDSIYSIIGFRDPNNIIVNVNNGGVPSSALDGYRPSFTSRSSINYRVIDIGAAGTTTGIADGNYLVFQCDATGINTGQANPQLQLLVANSNQRIDYNMSPNGSWTGSAFGADASGARQPNTGQANTTQNQQNTTSSGTMNITLIGDKDFLIGYAKDSGHASSNGFNWHWEIPERLYTQAQDLNPFTMQINGYANPPTIPFISSTTTYGYGGGFVMRCNDGTYRNHRTSVKALMGDGGTNLFFSAMDLARVPGASLVDTRVATNSFSGTVINSSGFLSMTGVVGQYSLARVRLRRVRFANAGMKLFTRFSGNGDWLLLTHGIAVPWDKTVLPLTIFPFAT